MFGKVLNIPLYVYLLEVHDVIADTLEQQAEQDEWDKSEW